MAFKLAGIDENTPDPPGGEIERDKNGETTGVLKENARSLLAPLLPLESFGQKNPAFAIPIERLNRNRRIFAADLKLIGDGSVSGRTAWLNQPYLGTKDEYGICVCDDSLMESAIEYRKRNHCQLSMHAMGSRAIERMVNRAACEEAWTPAGIPYVRIEHGTDPTDESLEKSAVHGISFVTQPIFLYAESASYRKNLGSDWMKRCYPIRRILEKGVRLGFSTDAPATFWSVPSDPFPGLKLAVTRTAANGCDCGADQAVDIETAIGLYTRGAALAAGFQDIGMLAMGYHGDFAVLSDDILAIPAEAIDKVQVEETFVEGKCVYRR